MLKWLQNTTLLLLSISALAACTTTSSTIPNITDRLKSTTPNSSPVYVELDSTDPLRSVNTFVNTSLSYKADTPGNDYWQSPTESYKLKTGDCEDYAVYKYWILNKHYGYSLTRLAIAILYDKKKAEHHAVLVVDNRYVLDNMSLRITPGLDSTRYNYLEIVRI